MRDHAQWLITVKIIERAQNDLARLAVAGRWSLVVNNLPVTDIDAVVGVAEVLCGEVIADSGSGHKDSFDGVLKIKKGVTMR